MAGEWPVIAMGEVAAVRSGYAFKSRDWKESGIPVVKIANVKSGRLEMAGCSFVDEAVASGVGEFRLSVGDILVAMTGYVGDVARVRESDLPCVLNQRVGKFTVLNEERLDADYLFQFLAWSDTRQTIAGLGYGSAQPNVSPSLIHKIEIPLPPLPEQKRIAHILGTLDDKIELNRRMNGTLEGISRAIFKSWFVDFDPVRQKAAGKQPVGMDAQTAALFPDSFEDSEIGEVPKGWSDGVVGDYANLNPESWSKAMYPDEVRYVDLSSTKWGEVEAIETHERHSAPSRAQRILRPGDTIFGTVRPGNGSFAMVEDDGLTGSTGFAVLRPKCGEFREYVYLATTIAENVDRLAHLADGGAYPAIRPEVVADTPLTAAPHALVAKFSDCTAACFKQIARNRREARTLAALRDTLLPKLLSGEIRAPEAEQTVGEAIA
jgi:type I restriction enzyme S subunit